MSTKLTEGENPMDEFDLGFDEDESEDYQDHAMEMLPESPHLDRQRVKNTMYGTTAESFGGRGSSPKLFSQQALFPQVTQLRCWRIENGTPTGIGVIDANANEEEFVQTFSSAMPKQGEGTIKFKLRPLDIDGRELGQEITLAISEHHSALKYSHNVNKRTTAVNAAVAEQQTMQSVIDMLKETLRHSQSALEEERRRGREIMNQMAQERIDLASNAASGVQIISERMMDADAKRHEVMLKQEQVRNQQAQDNMSAFFQTQSEMQMAERARQQDEFERQRDREKSYHGMMLQLEQQRQERERASQESMANQQMQNFQMMLEQERIRRDREKQEYQERLDQQRQEWEMRRQQERDDYERKERVRLEELKEKEAERRRQHDMRLKELELAAQRDREHAERMMQLQALQVQNEKQGSFRETLKEGMETLTQFGIDPTDLVQKLLGGDNGSNAETIIGALSGVAGKVADVVKENVRATGQVNAAKAQAQMMQQNPMMGMPQYGMVPYGMNPQMQQQMAMQQQQQMAMQQFEGDDSEDDSEFLEQEPIYVGKRKVPQSEAIEPIEIDLPLATQKSARKALRTMVRELLKTENEGWEGVITMGLVNEPSIYHYIQAVTVDYALKEAGAKSDFKADIVSALRASPLVPDELNYGDC
jgi:hypothetical protein